MLAELYAHPLFFVLLALPIIPNMWAIWHLYTHEFNTPQERAAWLVAQVVLPVLGGLGYILFGRTRARKHISGPQNRNR